MTGRTGFVPGWGDSPPRVPRSLPQLLADYERIIIIKSLQASGGSRSAAARTLGVRRQYLYARIRRLGVRLEEIPARSAGGAKAREQPRSR